MSEDPPTATRTYYISLQMFVDETMEHMPFIGVLPVYASLEELRLMHEDDSEYLEFSIPHAQEA